MEDSSLSMDLDEVMVGLESEHPSLMNGGESERPSSQVSVKVHQFDSLMAQSPDLERDKGVPVSEPSVSSSNSEGEVISPSVFSGHHSFGGMDLSPPRSSFDQEVGDSTKIGLSCLPEQRQKFCEKLGGQFNLMVAGQMGIGKTTFINTLFNENLVEIDHSPVSSSYSITKFELTENNFPLRLNIVETSGLGSHLNNEGCWIPFINYIDDQFKTYLFQEQQPDRTNKVDNRIHCCIYFLGANLNQISPLDLSTIKALTSRVNVIPVIGKSDCLKADELESLKKNLKNYFSEHQISFCDFLNDEELSMRINDNLPFTIIGSNEVNREKVRIRQYPWGSIEINNPEYCQFSALSKILIEENMLDFLLSTESHYEIFRNDFLSKALKDSNTSADNGLEELKIYSGLTYQQHKDSLKDVDEILQYKEDLLRAKFNEEINDQEKRFKEWKKKLVAKQNELNDDIELHHAELIELQETVTTLEEGFGMTSTHGGTLSRTTFSLGNEIINGKQEMKSLTFPFQ